MGLSKSRLKLLKRLKRMFWCLYLLIGDPVSEHMRPQSEWKTPYIYSNYL